MLHRPCCTGADAAKYPGQARCWGPRPAEISRACSELLLCMMARARPLWSNKDWSALQATMEWEAQDEGVLAKILMGDGAKDIAVGTPVAVIVEEAKDVRQIAIC